KHFEVVINTTKVAEDHLLRTGTTAQIQDAVTKTLRELDGHFSPDFVLHNVRIGKGNKIVLHAANASEAEKMRRLQGSWVPRLGAGLTVSERTFSVTVHGVPVGLIDPAGGATASVLHGANRSFIQHPSHIKSIRHLQGAARTQRSNKTHSSVVVSLTDARAADDLICHGTSFDGQHFATEKYIPLALQCYGCQQFGHIASACPFKSDPSRVRCAHCADNHCQGNSPFWHYTATYDAGLLQISHFPVKSPKPYVIVE
ncbi:hypothetical protein R3P38DRAFT_2584785, partial [Favolaschia claudopus]